MRFRLLLWILIFSLGVLVGGRYGLPGWASFTADRLFSPVEGWFGGLGKPLPEHVVPDIEEDDDNAADEGQQATDESAADEADPAPAAQAYAPSNNDGLRINQAGLNIIKESEGLRLEAYDLNGQWLIGYGHSRTAKQGMTITKAQAEQLLREDVAVSEDAVRSMVTVPVNTNQFSAMVSLAYNMGSGGFSRSDVLKRVNQGDYKGAAEAFLKHNKAGGVVNEHLVSRREKERALFLR